MQIQNQANTKRPVISLLMVFSILFQGFSSNLEAQVSRKPDIYPLAAGKIFLARNIDKKISKMSARSFTATKAQTAKSVSNPADGSDAGALVNYTVLNVEFRDANSRAAVFSDTKKSTLKNTYVLTVIDRFADVFVTDDDTWNALERNPAVLKVEFAGDVKAPPPPPIEPAKMVTLGIPENIVRGGYKGLTGEGVTIAILDTGIDFRHPDFITYDSQNQPVSRIAYLWDTAAPFQEGRGNAAPYTFPNGAPIGTLYTNQQLTAELRSTVVTIPPTDLDGHGTACASVAAGNGEADNRPGGFKRKDVVGVAPKANIIGVRLGAGEDLENVFLLNTISEWLETVTGPKTPLVISGSFSGQYSGHDGQSVRERQLNARFPLNKAGRAIVFSAGNARTYPIHAKAVFSRNAKTVTWVAHEKTIINLFFDSDDPGIRLSPTNVTPLGNNLERSLNPITNQLEARLVVEPGPGGIVLDNPGNRNTEAHLYFSGVSLGEFTSQSAVESHLVGAPGTMENAITVASYDWNDNFHSRGRVITLASVCDGTNGSPVPFEIGWLSCYSSPGPSRRKMPGQTTEIVKPDIAAPGEWYASANAMDGKISAGRWASPDTTGYYRQMNGTSAATPYTAGIVALMFQRNKNLTLGEVKRLFWSEATKEDLNPGQQGAPNRDWGYGKLDYAAVTKIFALLDKNSP